VTQGNVLVTQALLRQFRPAIVRYCRARLARTRTRTLDEDDAAQEVCLALLSALPSHRDMGRPFGAFVVAIAAHKVADAASTPGSSAPCWLSCPPRNAGCSCSGWWLGCRPRTPGTCSTLAAHEGRTGELGALGPAQRRSQ
jgi:Sigma-70 region 2